MTENFYAQDIVLRKTAKQIAEDPYLRGRASNVSGNSEERQFVTTNRVQQNIITNARKLDEHNDAGTVPIVSLSVSQAIQKARLAKGFNQKDLATKINEKQGVINEYESGKAIPNPQILGKLERILGVKLRGKDIGSELKKN